MCEVPIHRAIITAALLAAGLTLTACSSNRPTTPAPAGSDVTNPSQATEDTEATASTEPPAAASDVSFGQAATGTLDGHPVKFQVTKVTVAPRDPDGIFNPPAGQMSVLVEFRVTNTGSTPLRADAIVPTVYYGPDAQTSSIGSAKDDPITATRLQPGKTARATSSWDIPKGENQVIVGFTTDAGELTFKGTVS
jgi:hypothetical protein